MFQAVIFDLDGLLIDSEPLWRDAEIRVLGGVGVPMTSEMAAQTVGMTTNETVRHWHSLYPWGDPPEDEIGRRIDQTVLELIKKNGEPKNGVREAIAVCQRLGLPMAIASSSSMTIINAVVEKLDLVGTFKKIQSAESEAFGKPNPAVYIDVAKKLDVDVQACLVLEDSINGVLSAKAAEMYCIAVPAAEDRHDKRFGIADKIVDSLLDVNEAMVRGLAQTMPGKHVPTT